ncbi:MAG: cellulose synthase operon protein YhjQ/BcsQ [Pirellulales bacterium]
MTTLNKAFLRAYTRDRQPASGGPHLPLPEAAPTGPEVHAAFQQLTAPPVPVPAPPPAPAPTPLPPVRSVFAPAWEVDSLPWSGVCDQMHGATGGALAQALEDWRKNHPTTTGVVGVTSLIRREGRSTLAACLARSAAHSGQRVALLDADLESPRLSATLELDLETGWTDTVLHGAALTEAAVRSVTDRLVVFPLAPTARLSPLSWSAAATNELFQALRDHFDLVVVDLGPLTDVLKRGLQGGSDGPLDGTIILRDVRITGADQVLLIARELHQAGLHIIGVVDNFHEADTQWSATFAGTGP